MCRPGGWRTEHGQEEEEDEADEGEGTEEEAGGHEVIVDVPKDVEAGGRAGDGDVSGQLEEQAGQTRHWHPRVAGHL